MTDLLAIAVAFIVLALGYAILMRLLKTLAVFAGEVVEATVALFFFLVIVPLVWMWERGRRPMWRTLSLQQTRELQAWLRHR